MKIRDLPSRKHKPRRLNIAEATKLNAKRKKRKKKKEEKKKKKKKKERIRIKLESRAAGSTYSGH
ncbi:uncharacterized protein KY384_005626 [Bacidia gigantensis]|uniref:uncharacterized protein n=1 Tax=Bacidia gigantensis TaxID=2732470 RepID=UPI001D036F39|nr:uncharacterized protein KY384_005626 [Bacidia gigantensis]KAG8530143.1 hypothetical protein KY384_005626 [Bacidia gigantensis]